MTHPPPKEVILEQIKVGGALKIIAIDPATGTEVTFQAPARASQQEIRQLAVNKLTYVLSRQHKN